MPQVMVDVAACDAAAVFIEELSFVQSVVGFGTSDYTYKVGDGVTKKE